MNTLFAEILYQLEKKKDVVLVTIVAQEGSSPRGTGAQMLVKKDGSILGSVGGGAVEQHCRELANKSLKEKNSFLQNYTLRQEGANSIGMVCGGDMSVFSQYIDSQNAEWAALSRKMLDIFATHQLGWLVLDLKGGLPAILSEKEENLFGQPGTPVPSLGRKCCIKTDSCFFIPLMPASRAILFGGGHCAQALTPFLSKVGFRVTVMDNRPEYATAERFPEAEQVIYGDYNQISKYLTIEPSDYIVIMSNGHAHDLDIQKQVLQHPTVYVGVIGSKSKKAYVNARLRELGISEEAINCVHSPVGTNIMAVTPEEIAISIAGEMIYERALLRESPPGP